MSELLPKILIFGVGVPIALALFAFWIWMLIDCLKSERYSGQERLVWVVVIVLLKFIGAGIYYFMEHRPHRAPSAA